MDEPRDVPAEPSLPPAAASGTPAPAGGAPGYADPDADRLSWISALALTMIGAVATGAIFWFLLIIGIVIVGATSLDELQALNNDEDGVRDFVLNKAGTIAGILVGLLVALAPTVAAIYKLMLDLLFDHTVGFGWALLAVLAGWLVAPAGLLLDALLGGLSLGLGAAIANGAVTAAILRQVSRPKSAGAPA